MQTFRKNQIIITALVIMIAIAGYLNFVDNSSDDESKFVFNEDQQEQQQGDTQNENSTETASTALVPNENSQQTSDITQNTDNTNTTNTNQTNTNETTEQNSNNTNNDASQEAAPTVADNGQDENVGEAVLAQNVSGFYLKTKIEREQARAKMMEVCKEVMNNQNTPQEQKVKAANDMLSIKDRIEKEASAEAMLEAKGFKEVYVRINENSVDVVVDAKELNDADKAKILDIVERTTGVDPLKIVITPLNTQN